MGWVIGAIRGKNYTISVLNYINLDVLASSKLLASVAPDAQ